MLDGDIVRICYEIHRRTTTMDVQEMLFRTLINPLENKLQEYLVSPGFVDFQHQNLQMYVGILCYLDISQNPDKPQPYYLWGHPESHIQLKHLKRDPVSDEWTNDPEEGAKRLVAIDTRVARRKIEFYDFLNDPEAKSERLTDFEQRMDILYAPDGEESALCLAWILRLYRAIAKKRWSEWNDVEKDNPEPYRISPFPIQQLTALAPSSEKRLPPFPNLKDPKTLKQELNLLGLTSNKQIIMPRFRRMVEWLKWSIESNNYARLFRRRQDSKQIFTIVNKKKTLDDLEKLLEQFSTARRLTNESWHVVCDILLSNGEEAHEFAERLRFPVAARYRSRIKEYAPRAWLVFPVLRYPLSTRKEVREVGFFLCGFDDSSVELNISGSPSHLEDVVAYYKTIVPKIAYLDNFYFYHKIFRQHETWRTSFGIFRSYFDSLLRGKPHTFLDHISELSHGRVHEDLRPIYPDSKADVIFEDFIYYLLTIFFNFKTVPWGARLPPSANRDFPDGAFRVQDRVGGKSPINVIYECKTTKHENWSNAREIKLFVGYDSLKVRQGLIKEFGINTEAESPFVDVFLLFAPSVKNKDASRWKTLIPDEINTPKQRKVDLKVFQVPDLCKFVRRVLENPNPSRLKDNINWYATLTNEKVVYRLRDFLDVPTNTGESFKRLLRQS